MINSVILIGNLTKDPQFFKTQSGISYARFTVATTKKYKDNEETAFISCIAWRQSADFLNQYAKKGNTISVEGHITTGSYDDKTTGKKIYTTDVTVDRVHLIGRSSNPTTQQTDSTVDELEFDTGSPISISSDDLPF
jgi:single-strand DNA-binding protein